MQINTDCTQINQLKYILNKKYIKISFRTQYKYIVAFNVLICYIIYLYKLLYMYVYNVCFVLLTKTIYKIFVEYVSIININFIMVP